MKRILSVALILLLSASTLASCNPDTGSESGTTAVTDATGGSVTGTATETQTEMPTETVTEPGTDAPTEPPTETSAEPSDTEAPDPLETPVRVGTGYDGKTACYDGRLRHMYESFSTGYGGTFDSVQEAMDSLAGIGGTISAASNGDIGLCLSVKVPDDGKKYILYYNFNNCDFVFNFGCTFDDGNGGYAYYSSLNILDDMAEDLDGCQCVRLERGGRSGARLLPHDMGRKREGNRRSQLPLR